jgi:hypothetical protein
MTSGIAANVKILYVDPLVANARNVFTRKQDVDENLQMDYLISSYIPKLDEEIFSNLPLGLTEAQIQIWNDNRLSDLFTEMLNQARGHGYSTVQFNTLGYQIFGEMDRMTWVIDEKTQMPKGITIVKDIFEGATKIDSTPVNVIWDDKSIFLFKWNDGNKKTVFAYSDLNQAMWTVAVAHRQIQTGLDLMASKPQFMHVHLGSPTPEQEAALMNALAETSLLQALGTSDNICPKIDVISYEKYDELLTVLADKRKQFASLTRLPLAYYNGERTSGSGTGGAAEDAVEIKINKRKQLIFNKIKPLIVQVMQIVYGQDVSSIEFDLQLDVTENVEQVEVENTNEERS